MSASNTITKILAFHSHWLSRDQESCASFIIAEKSRLLWTPSATWFLELPYVLPICGPFQAMFSQSSPSIHTELMLNFELPIGILIEQDNLTYALSVATAPKLSYNRHNAPVS